MAKGTTRGKRAGDVARRSLGTCPLCGTKTIKLAYSKVIKGQTVHVCKRCRNKQTA